jgi:hypothetical protein
VIAVNTLPSYQLLLSAKYYNLQDYFWVPGALRDYDIPDLVRLAATRKQMWIDPVDALSKPLAPKEASEIMGNINGLEVFATAKGQTDEISEKIRSFLEK